MGKKANEEKLSPTDCRKCGRWKAIREKVRVAELLEKAIATMEKKIAEKDFKPTVAEYLKLLQLEQELDQDEAKEIKVTWVEPLPKSKEE
jgi:hypothetical protein